jgi:hypothetical protein
MRRLQHQYIQNNYQKKRRLAYQTPGVGGFSPSPERAVGVPLISLGP